MDYYSKKKWQLFKESMYILYSEVWEFHYIHFSGIFIYILYIEGLLYNMLYNRVYFYRKLVQRETKWLVSGLTRYLWDVRTCAGNFHTMVNVQATASFFPGEYWHLCIKLYTNVDKAGYGHRKGGIATDHFAFFFPGVYSRTSWGE